MSDVHVGNQAPANGPDSSRGDYLPTVAAPAGLGVADLYDEDGNALPEA